jgi:hypothetical protein
MNVAYTNKVVRHLVWAVSVEWTRWSVVWSDHGLLGKTALCILRIEKIWSRVVDAYGHHSSPPHLHHQMNTILYIKHLYSNLVAVSVSFCGGSVRSRPRVFKVFSVWQIPTHIPIYVIIFNRAVQNCVGRDVALSNWNQQDTCRRGLERFALYVPLIEAVESYIWYRTPVFALLHLVATRQVGRRTKPSASWSMPRTDVYCGVYWRWVRASSHLLYDSYV